MSNIINIGGTSGGSGSSVIANPQGAATDTLNKLQVDGTIYGVSGGGSSGHNYSTTEQVVGTWVDGSTLYEKTIVGDDTYNQQFNYIPHGITNLDKIIDYFGYCYYGGTDFSLIPYLRGNTYITVTTWDSTNIRVERTGLSSSFTGVRLVIRYTKTTT